MRLELPADYSVQAGLDELPVIRLRGGWKVAHSGSRGEMPHVEPVAGG